MFKHVYQMAKILHVISSPRGEASNSIKLGNAIIDKIKEQHSETAVTVRDLTKGPFPHLEEAHLNAFFTPVEQHTEENKEAIRHSNEAIKEIFDADILVIDAPMYNFSIPSTLKSWIDHIARAGITFRYTATGPEGLIKGKKVYLAITTGGVYSSGPAVSSDFVAPYLKAVLGFVGLTDVVVNRAEGFAMPDLQADALQKGIDNINL
jgi:FMN-dependent NADH-azoreductase